jgi:hypothetical protein
MMEEAEFKLRRFSIASTGISLVFLLVALTPFALSIYSLSQLRILKTEIQHLDGSVKTGLHLTGNVALGIVISGVDASLQVPIQIPFPIPIPTCSDAFLSGNVPRVIRKDDGLSIVNNLTVIHLNSEITTGNGTFVNENRIRFHQPLYWQLPQQFFKYEVICNIHVIS